MLRNKKGFTLIELILAVGILLTVIIVTTTMLGFSMKAFDHTQIQAENQRDVRNFFNLVEKEVSLASYIELKDDLPTVFDESYRYIYIEDNQLKQKLPGKTPSVLMLGLGGVNMDSEIKMIALEDDVLRLEIAKTNLDSDYFLNKEIHLKNLLNSIEGAKAGKVLVYHFNSDAKEITGFSILKEHQIASVQNNWNINNDRIDANILGSEIWIALPSEIDRSQLVFTYSTTGSKVTVNNIEHHSSSSSINLVAADETVNYKVHAYDGSENEYTLSYSILDNPPPDARRVRVLNLGRGYVWINQPVEGRYIYASNGNGVEGESLYTWIIADDEDGSNEKIIINQSNILTIPNLAAYGVEARKFIALEVIPVASNGVEGEAVRSEFIEIYPDLSPLWMKITDDIHFLNLTSAGRQEYNDRRKEDDPSLPDYEEEVLVMIRHDFNIYRGEEFPPGNYDVKFDVDFDDPDNPSLTVQGRHTHNSSAFTIDIEKFLDNQGLDNKNYSLELEAELKAGEPLIASGWGLLVNGQRVITDADEFKASDSGYTFQFDPGLSGTGSNDDGFVLRAMRNSVHLSGEYGIQSRNTYLASYLLNDEFKRGEQEDGHYIGWGNSNTVHTDHFGDIYSTKLYVYEREDNNNLILGAKTRRVTSDRRDTPWSNLMWFGHDGIVDSPNTTHVYPGRALPASTVMTNPLFANQWGNVLGFRIWQNASNLEFGRGYEVKFHNIVLDTGISLDISEARFLTPSIISATFESEIQDTFDIDLIELNLSNEYEISHVERSQDNKNTALIFLNQDVSNDDGVTIKMAKGAVKHIVIGDFDINGGNNVDVLPLSSTLFYDEDFDGMHGLDSNWKDFGSGKFMRETTIKKEGVASLRKYDNGDPNGAYREFKDNESLNRGEFIFEGWLYSSVGRTSGLEDRLSLLNEDNNGYGLSVRPDYIALERRDNGSPTNLDDTRENTVRKNGEWYRFVFISNKNNTFSLFIFDESGGLKEKTFSKSSSTEYNNFNKVVIHGGTNYYVDELKIYKYD